MRIGERIKQRRLELGYTADALAKLLNKNRATIYRYENGDIENITILDGHKFLQNATIEAINEAAKSFPKTNQSIEIQIPIEYKII